MSVPAERLRQDLAEDAARVGEAAPVVSAPVAQLLRLQASAGNQAVMRMLAQSRRNALMREDGSESESESESEGGGGTALKVSPEEEKRIREKAKANAQLDFDAPPHTPQDTREVKTLLLATVPKDDAPREEIVETIDELDADTVESRKEAKTQPSPAVLPEDEEEELSEDEGENPVAVIEQLQGGGEHTDDERDDPLPPTPREHGPLPPTPDDSSEESSESVTPPKLTVHEIDFATDGIDDLVEMIRIPGPPKAPDQVDLGLLQSELEVAASELAAVARRRRPPGAVKATADESVDTGDKLLGPSAEASATWAPSQVTSVTGPLTTADTDSGGGVDATGVLGTDAFFTSFAATGDAVGGFARIITGIKRAHEGRKTGNHSDLVGGLLDVLNGLGTAVKSGVGIVGKALGEAAPKALGIFGSILGVVLGLITSVRYAVASDKAFTREMKVRDLQHTYERQAREARADGGATSKEDYEFYRVMRAAAFVMKHKSQRRGIKKLIGFGGAGLGVIGGIALTAGLFGLANIWNPVGWAIGGAAALIALGLTSWAIYRRIRRHRNRKDLTERAADERVAVAPSQYADYIIKEATCSKHANSVEHQQVAIQFLERVLGRKRAGKLLTLAPEKAVKQLSKKFGS